MKCIKHISHISHHDKLIHNTHCITQLIFTKIGYISLDMKKKVYRSIYSIQVFKFFYQFHLT